MTKIIIDVIDRMTEGHEVSMEDKQFIAEFISYGVSGSVTKWVRTGMKQSPEATVKYLQDIVNGFKAFAAYYNRDLPHS